MAKRYALTAWLLVSLFAHSKERCVPDKNGEWLCGKDITAADAAPLPKSTTNSAPPPMLLDPRQFGARRNEEATIEQAASNTDIATEEAPQEARAQASTPNSSMAAEETQSEALAPGPLITSEKAQTNPSPAIAKTSQSPVQAKPVTDGRYTVQLALASGTQGFAPLLEKLRIAPNRTRRVQLANGMWALLMGEFSSIEAARNAIPLGASGAFARANFIE